MTAKQKLLLRWECILPAIASFQTHVRLHEGQLSKKQLDVKHQRPALLSTPATSWICHLHEHHHWKRVMAIGAGQMRQVLQT